MDPAQMQQALKMMQGMDPATVSGELTPVVVARRKDTECTHVLFAQGSHGSWQLTLSYTLTHTPTATKDDEQHGQHLSCTDAAGTGERESRKKGRSKDHAKQSLACCYAHCRGCLNTSTSFCSGLSASGETLYFQAIRGGADTMIDSMRPPSSPNFTPRS